MIRLEFRTLASQLLRLIEHFVLSLRIARWTMIRNSEINVVETIGKKGDVMKLNTLQTTKIEINKTKGEIRSSGFGVLLGGFDEAGDVEDAADYECH